MLKKMWIAAAMAVAMSGPVVAQTLVEAPAKVQYAVTEEQPATDSSNWRDIKPGFGGEAEIDGVQQFKRFWIRAKSDDADARWAVYGPLSGESQDLDVVAIEDEGQPAVVQFGGAKASVDKGFKCCKVRVRVRIVTKVPSVTVKKPSVTIRWRDSLPQVTVKGPEVTIKDLPEIKIPDFEVKLPSEGTPNAGMRCEIVQGEAKLWVQNGEKTSIDVWLNWKGVSVYGPIRIEGNTERSLGGVGYNDCKVATDNIYITKAEFR